MESSNLKATLIQHGFHSIQADEVLNFSNKNDYQLACTKHFEIMNGYQPTEIINNPNRYYELTQMVKQNRSKHTLETSDNNKSLNDSLYDKHLWEMLSPAKDSMKKAEMIADPMSQIDFNY